MLCVCFIVQCFQIILFQFGLGANAHYVILELYAQGNILLTDSEFMVLTLLRSHRLVISDMCLFCFQRWYIFQIIASMFFLNSYDFGSLFSIL